MKFKKWIPEMMLGAMADNINSGSTPPDRIFEG